MEPKLTGPEGPRRVTIKPVPRHARWERLWRWLLDPPSPATEERDFLASSEGRGQGVRESGEAANGEAGNGPGDRAGGF